MTDPLLLQIDTGYACAGIVVEDGVCTEAAPIFAWMVGKSLEEIKRWRKIQNIEPPLASPEGALNYRSTRNEIP